MTRLTFTGQSPEAFNMTTPIITRFAPSPTGFLHVGGARTALFNWLLAKHTGGQFVLRIEDTDLARSTEESVKAVLEDLQWLGLNWDNTELVFQSKRVDIYNQIINDLIAKGQAYEAFETPEELDAQRKIAERAKRPYIYRRPNLTDAQIQQYKSEGRKSVVRFVMPVKEYSFYDAVLGKDVTIAPSQVQDFVIRKTDGMPTYHFAVVVDDAAMGITHILRGQEHLLNTMNHVALQEALAYIRPTYGHLPVILNTDGSKMGKRDRDKKVRHHANLYLKNTKAEAAELAAKAGLDPQRIVDWLAADTMQLTPTEQTALMPIIGLREVDLPEILVHDFRKNGYLPEVLLNFLALLGWSPGGDLERMTVAQLVEKFELSGIGKSNAKFNREKLLAFNTEALSAASPERLLAAMRDFLSVNPDSPLNKGTDAQLAAVLHMNAGMRTLREADDKSRFLFVAASEIQYDAKAVDKVLIKGEKQGANALADLLPLLQGMSDWSAASLEATVKAYCEQKQLGLGKVAQPLRVAVCGTTISPPIFESLALLGKDATCQRISNCLAKL